MIDAILAKVFGTKNKREIKAIQPIVAAINYLLIETFAWFARPVSLPRHAALRCAVDRRHLPASRSMACNLSIRFPSY